jgi:hypothetical protein
MIEARSKRGSTTKKRNSAAHLSIWRSAKRLLNEPATEGCSSMKYLCLVYFAAEKWEALSVEEREALTRESLAYDQTLRQKGHFLAAQALEPVTAAVTVRSQDGRITTIDGPFAETKEQLCGFILIDARDLNEAVQVASHIPVGRLGSVEVRPVAELELKPFPQH